MGAQRKVPAVFEPQRCAPMLKEEVSTMIGTLRYHAAYKLDDETKGEAAASLRVYPFADPE